jgi:trimethylamine:corrinoid methyltransferase-like protein
MVRVESLSDTRGPRPQRSRGGRAARHRLREANNAPKAVGPGLKGGSYKPLSDRDLARIHETVLDVLEKIGIGDPPTELVELAEAKGCWLNAEGRICFPRAFVEDVIAGACHEFTLHGRDPAYDIALGATRSTSRPPARRSPFTIPRPAPTGPPRCSTSMTRHAWSTASTTSTASARP